MMEYRVLSVWVLALILEAAPSPAQIARPVHSLETTPQNVAVLVGDNVRLSCGVIPELPTYRLQWWEYASTPSGSLISDNDYLAAHPERDRFTLIRNSPNQYDLQISDVKLSDGGRYRCSESIQQPTTNGFAELIVLDGVLECITTLGSTGEVLEYQYVSSECYQYYQGNVAPTITWAIPQAFDTLSSTTSASVWSGAFLNVSRVSESQSISAITSFVGSIIPDNPESAGNTPTYQQQYDSASLTIYWGPQNIYIDPVKSEYQVDDMITCFASAKPEASIAMRNMRTGLISDGAFFPVEPELAGTTQTVRCTARNIIFNRSYTSEFDFQVTVA